MRNLLLLTALLGASNLFSQEKPDLTVSKIMQDPKSWVGTSPSGVYWSEDSKTIYFDWNADMDPSDSLYSVAAPWTDIKKVSQTSQRNLPGRGVYNKSRTVKLYVKNGDIYLLDLRKNREKRLTNTVGRESSPGFTQNEDIITFTSDDNLFTMSLDDGKITQLTNFSSRNGRRNGERTSEQDEWLEKDQLEMFKFLKEDKERSEQRNDFNKKFEEKRPTEKVLGRKRVNGLTLSPTGDFITYNLFESAGGKRTIVPDYVTESGYTEDLNARTKVGSPLSSLEAWIYNPTTGKHYEVKVDGLSGLEDAPEYYEEYDKEFDGKREVYTHSPLWSEDGKYAVVSFRSKDNKDRWITLLDPSTGEVKELDRQHDEAWIAGPGIGWSFSSGVMAWMPDNRHIYFQSEESGYSHLYSLNVETGKKTALTSGEFEIYNPRISRDEKSWYFEANMTHPGIVQFYKMPINGGTITALTDMGGKAVGILSPDEKSIAILHSKSNQPTELYVMSNGGKAGTPKKITNSQTDEWKSYPWRVPEYITFTARDGAEVHARLYRPENSEENGPAVIFVHGAGYLQNAHQWWSSYFREYMFHNLLADKGYTVLDIDYRGSAGYGRDWRTGIYQHMGGFDLTDQVDGASHLVSEYNIDPERIGIYGGSYGGFITLMAMFTEQETFAAGAALRSVTDWAHYNHGYTSNILNTPVNDSIAYRKSSPIYYAEGLQGALLICHGMIDTNVHFQDVVRLAQRLIELRKEDWEFAVYPKEGHGFVHPDSWTDEYRRILKLFEENLR